MYEPPSSLLSYLPFTVEWNAIALLLFLSALVSPRILPIAAVPLGISVAWSIATAMRARVDPRFSGVRARALIALLTYLGPVVRGGQRYLWRLRGMGNVDRVDVTGPKQTPRIDWRDRAYTVSYWSEQGHEKEALIAAVMEFLIPRKYLIAVDPGWNHWDLEIFRGLWAKARLTVASENHGGAKRLLNARVEVRTTRVAQLAALGYTIAVVCGLLFSVPEVTSAGIALGLVSVGVVVSENFRLARILQETLDLVATRIALRPMGGDASPAQAA
jgi:hypothetical protein